MSRRVKNPPAMQETLEMRVPSLGQKDPPEKGMATHSSILAWRIPWTEEPGRLSLWGHKESDTTKHAGMACKETGGSWPKRRIELPEGFQQSTFIKKKKKEERVLGSVISSRTVLWLADGGDAGITIRPQAPGDLGLWAQGHQVVNFFPLVGSFTSAWFSS